MLKVRIFFAALFSSMLFASTEELAKDMQEKIADLSETQNFTFVDLGLSYEDLLLIDQFTTKITRQYSRFGNLGLLQSELPIFLHGVGDNNPQLVQKITQTIYEIALAVCKAAGMETAWVCVRASTPTDVYDIPRWHQDGYYYSPYSGFAFKFATALKGNPTLFYQMTKEQRDTFTSNEHDRKFLSYLLREKDVQTPKLGQGAFFIVGDNRSAAAHSEPQIHSERLFFSVIPGSEMQINELKARWNPQASSTTKRHQLANNKAQEM